MSIETKKPEDAAVAAPDYQNVNETFNALFGKAQTVTPTDPQSVVPAPPDSMFSEEPINNRLFIVYYNKDGKLRKLCDCIRGKKLIQNIQTGQTRMVCEFIKMDGKLGEIILPKSVTQLNGNSTLNVEVKKELADRISIYGSSTMFCLYMNDEFDRLQRKGLIEYDISSCDVGIAEIDDGERILLLDDAIIPSKSNFKLTFPICKDSNPAYKSRGDLKENFRFIEKNYKTRGIWFMHFASLGSPLFSMLEDRKECRLIIPEGITRSGKSTAMRAGLHLWSYAQLSHDGTLLTCKSTVNSLQEKLGGRHIFMAINDMQAGDEGSGKKVASEFYGITDGVTRSKLNKDSTQRPTKTYSGYIALGAEEDVLNLGDSKTHGRNSRVLVIKDEVYTTSSVNADDLNAGFRHFASNIGRVFMQHVFDRNNGDYMLPLVERYEQLKSHMRHRLRRISDNAFFSLADSLTPCIIASEIWNEWVPTAGFSRLVYDTKIIEDFLVEKIIRQSYHIKGHDARYMPETLYPFLKEYATISRTDYVIVKADKREICFEGKFFDELMKQRRLEPERTRSVLKEFGCTIQDQIGKTTAHRTFTINGEKEYLPAIVLKMDFEDFYPPTAEAKPSMPAGKQLELIPCDEGDLPF